MRNYILQPGEQGRSKGSSLETSYPGQVQRRFTDYDENLRGGGVQTPLGTAFVIAGAKFKKNLVEKLGKKLANKSRSNLLFMFEFLRGKFFVKLIQLICVFIIMFIEYVELP